MAEETELELPKEDGGEWTGHLSAVHGIEFNQLSIAISVTAAAAPIILGFLYNLPPNCASPQGVTASKCIHDPAYLGLPLAPLSMVFFYGYLFLNSRLIGKYGRTLERDLNDRAAEGTRAATAGLHFPALSRLNGALYGGEWLRLAPFRVIFVMFAATILVVQIFTIYYLLGQLQNPNLREWGFVIYSILLGAAVLAFLGGGSHRVWEEMKKAAILRDFLSRQPFAESHSWLRFVGASLLPRPLSAFKAIDSVFLAGMLALMGLAPISHWDERRHVLLALLVALGLYDLVLYQTRYFLNAARESPDSEFDLPGDERTNSKFPWTPVQRLLAPAVGVARIVAFFLGARLFGYFDGHAAVVAVVAFAVAFYLYEIPP